MNERIEKLAKQAFGSTIDTDPILVYEAEKFAELIVEECVQRLRKEGELVKIQAFTGATYKFAYMNESANIIKQHFGIE